jgi:hypothetical protein
MLGDEDSVLVVEADGASVEGLVVQRTQGQTVVFCVRAGGGVPADVGGFDTQTRVFQHCIEAADGAAVLVALAAWAEVLQEGLEWLVNLGE